MAIIFKYQTFENNVKTFFCVIGAVAVTWAVVKNVYKKLKTKFVANFTLNWNSGLRFISEDTISLHGLNGENSKGFH